MHSGLQKLWLQAWSLILVEMTPQEIGWLLQSRDHISLLSSRRTTMIVSRVRLVAGLFAVLTPLWIIMDVIAFPPEVWLGLAVARISATVAFLAILVAVRRAHGMVDAYRALAMLLAVPTSFFMFSYQHMAQFEMHGLQAAFATGYAFLPFVMLAGLSIFPLTLLENLIFAAPMLAIQIVAATMRLAILDWPTFAASFWLLLLITAVAALSGISQLAFMIVLVREAIRDGLTGCFSRHSGEELLALQYNLSERNVTPLSVAFIDLDHFKQVNDRFGHDAGDQVLIGAVTALKRDLRTGDILIRWGGEEFLLILPGIPANQACIALSRLRQTGYGFRPDGTPVTASIGVAERQRDKTADWRQLVAQADARMYEAKQGGRDRVIGCA
jgi:diguanylate cyclase (GGDEF)-like protein